ncbi:MAG: hypothetical protein JO185_11530, partial [Acidobacteriaceae bacterium]|nr:hypothetical protein [Acidobacteriaceae bacterium]
MRRVGPALATVSGLLALLGAVPLLRAFQGMATAPLPNRRVPTIQTKLPPIEVDFRDVAEAARLTANNVSGSPAHKKYILETTGQGVGIFDYDNDGLP